MTLHEFLRLPHQFGWGGLVGDDCTTFCATWIDYQLGTDPANGLRGAYDTEEGAHAILNDAGGLAAFIDERLSPLGYVRTGEPADGDIGVVKYGGQQLSGIRFGPLWAVMSLRGVQVKKLEFVTAWSRRV